jgi:hypothetical protein
MLPLTAFNRLMNDPAKFLSRYPVRIAGAAMPSGVIQYHLNNRNYGNKTSRPDNILGTRSMHGTEAFSISSGASPMCHSFNAYSIEMVQSNVTPIALYTLPTGGPNIMVTGALTGCSFIIDHGPGGTIRCAHLQPNGETGAQLHARLKPLGYAKVYGRERYDHLYDSTNPLSYDRTVTIIGVRNGGKWKVFAQKLDMMNDFSIRSVHRIWPA